MTSAEEVAWHDAECGSYEGDLELWERLCDERGGPVLELGAGTGRLALHLARRGHEVTAVELQPELADELADRALTERLPIDVVSADARALELGRGFPLVLAPMQFMQLFLSESERRTVLAACARHLTASGVLAVAIVDGLPDELLPTETSPIEAIPDVREIDGVVYSSLPVASIVRGGTIESERLRQRVSPTGEMTEARHVDRLAVLHAADLQAEAAAAGLRSVAAEAIPPTDFHVGSRVVLFEAASGPS